MTWQPRQAGSRPASSAGERPRAPNVASEHRQVEVRELGVRRGLVAHGPQAEPREPQAEHAADEADDAGLDQELREDRALRRAERAAHADLRRAAQELRQQQADGVDQAHEQEAERDPGLQAGVARHDLLVVQPLP